MRTMLALLTASLLLTGTAAAQPNPDSARYEETHETQEPFRYEPGAQTGIQGPYLGQTPPGIKPEVFAPGLISTQGGFEFSCTFSPDGKEFYFNREFEISVCRWEEGGWTAPELVDFSNGNLQHEPHITADGSRLFFGGRRALEPGGEVDYAIWYMERQGDGWGEPRRHGPGMYVTTAANGNLYVTDIGREVGGGLAMQPWLGDHYGPMVRLPDHLNTPSGVHPCIAPDESWIIFDATRPDALGGEGDDDFYVSFRDGDTWGEPIHLPLGISDPGSNMCASVTPDGQYLFFHGRRDIHWVSTAVLDQFRPEVALGGGPYLGQTAPGATAEVFAPGLVSVTGRYEYGISFSPAGDRILFSVQNADDEVMVMHSRLIDDLWTVPQPVCLTRGFHADEMEAFFSPDGRHVYFAPYSEGMDVRIWQVEVAGDQWLEPVQLEGPIADHPAFYPTCADDGTLYYMNIAERRPYTARRNADGHWDAEPLAVEFGGHTFTAPDQSFVLMDARADDSLGKGDIYVAFADGEGGWTMPVNLGPDVNSTFGESCPSLSPDGQFVFFSRYDEEGERSQIYWVEAGVIEEARKRL